MIIKIENLRLKTIVGIYKWEKKIKQDVIINVEMEFDGSKAVETDNIKDTVDYKTITKKIIAMVEEREFNLIERITGEVMNIVTENERVRRAIVKIDKPGAIRFADSVSATHIMKR